MHPATEHHGPNFNTDMTIVLILLVQVTMNKEPTAVVLNEFESLTRNVPGTEVSLTKISIFFGATLVNRQFEEYCLEY